MANASAPRRSRRVLLLGAGLVAVSVCGVLALGSLLLVPSARPAAQMAAPTRTLASAGAAATSVPRDDPGVLATKSGGGGALATSAAQPTSEDGGTPPIAAAEPTSGDGGALPTAVPPPAAELATGELHFDYPVTLLIDKDEIVQLEIVPDQPVALAKAGAFGPAAHLLIETSPNDAERRSVAYAIPLYAVMSAELATARTDGLVIVAGSEPKQEIDPYDRNFWTWSLVARRGGEYRVTLRLFGYDSLEDEDPVRQVVNDTRILQVQDRPFPERLMQGLADNWLILFGAGGPIALIVAALSLWFARRDSRK